MEAGVRWANITASYLEDFKTSNVQDTNKASTLSLCSVQRSVDARDDPLEHSLIQCLGNGLHCKLNLKDEASNHPFIVCQCDIVFI